jgi:autotransporter-associated beta strand protein
VAHFALHFLRIILKTHVLPLSQPECNFCETNRDKPFAFVTFAGKGRIVFPKKNKSPSPTKRTFVHLFMKTRILLGSIAALLCSSAAFAQVPTFAWNVDAGGSWTNAANWNPNTGFPNGAGHVANINRDITAARTITLDAPITVGTLLTGDNSSGAAGFGYTINAGTGGTLTFDSGVAGTRAQLDRTNIGQTDTINAPVTLTSDLAVNLGTNGGAGLTVNGIVSGPGSLIRTGPGAIGFGAFFSLGGGGGSPANTYTGQTIVEQGGMMIRGSILSGVAGPVGQATSPIVLSNANTPASSGQFTANIDFRIRPRDNAVGDTETLTFERDFDFSQGNATNQGRTRLGFLANNGTGGANTNTFNLTGGLTFSSNAANIRQYEIQVQRVGQTLSINGPITGTTGQILWNGGLNPANFNGASGDGSQIDGAAGGTFRFSNTPRTYSNGQSLTVGTILISGSVGAAGTDGPVGRSDINLSDGNGGNIVTARGRDAVRSLLLEDAGASYARNIGMGGGTNTALAGLNFGVFNGIRIGGTNTSGTVTFSGNLNSQDPATAGVPAAGAVTVGNNLALIAQNGGTVNFSGIINDTPNAAHNTRLTINQLRNHPSLDENNDGTLNPEANALVGTATNGTVILSGTNTYQGTTEVLGGRLLVNGAINNGGTVTVQPGSTLGGNGTIAGVGTVEINGTLAPGASAGELTINKNLSLNSGSTFSLELDGSAAGVLGGYDQLTIGSSATISLNGAANVALALNFAPAINDSFTVIDNLGVSAIGGSFANLANLGTINAIFGGDTYIFQANYSGGDGNDLTLTVVPEASAMLALLGGMSLLAIRRQRRSLR